MARFVLLQNDGERASYPDAQVVARYPSGEVLIATDQPAPEDDRTPPPYGLDLPGVGEEQLERSRKRPQVESASESVLAYVTLAGPTVPAWLEALKRAGLSLRRFQPRTSYLVYGTRAALAEASKLPFVVSVTPLAPELKQAPPFAEEGDTDVWIVVEDLTDTAKVLAALSAVPGVVLAGQHDEVSGMVRVAASITSAAQSVLLALPLVLAIEPREPVRPEDEVAGLILTGQLDAQKHPSGSYLTWLSNQGLSGRGVAIGIVDNGVDETHEAFVGRIVAKESKRAWHGTFVAGHAAGNYLTEKDANGFIYGVGMAPAAEIITQDNARAAGDLCKETAATSGPRGARGVVQNNSWGAGTASPMTYGSSEAAYDALVRNSGPTGGTVKPLTICFSAGNEGAAGLTRPKSAKNILVTGNSESYRPSVGGVDSDDVDEMYTGTGASSHGNCGDGRIRPDVVAPGEWTSSANYDSHPGQAEFISPKLTWGGGTSGASPKTAGACALLIEWWRKENASVDPSPALLKALLVNGAEDMGFGGSVPNYRQGWGRLNLANVLSRDVHHVYVDQSSRLRQRGESRRWRVRPSDPSKPIRITLAWTDPPGAVGSGTATVSAIVNALGLRVTTAGATYYGNQFRDGFAEALAAPPATEGRDNLQCVYLRPGVAGTTIDVIVRALNVTQNCLTNRPDDPQQDFALVITNAYMDAGSPPTDLFVVVDDTSPGSSSSFDDHFDDDVDGGDEPAEPSDPSDPAPSDPAPTTSRPTLRRGAMGADVRELQRLLKEHGYLTTLPDGIFGGGTENAVKSFQRDRSLTADGVVGPATWAALEGGDVEPTDPTDPNDPSEPSDPDPTPSDPDPDPAPADPEPDPGPPTSRPTLRRGATGDVVRTLQQMLRATGFLAGNADGVFGLGTESAVKALQRSEGLTADGVVGAATWAALERLSDGDDDGGDAPSDPEPSDPEPSDPEPAPSDDDDGPPQDPEPPVSRPTLRRGATGEHVRALQRLLSDAGYLSGAADGVFGSGTEAAVKNFQRASGLTADGVVGANTWRALESASESERRGGTQDEDAFWADQGWRGWWEGSSVPAAEDERPGVDRGTLLAAAQRAARVGGDVRVVAGDPTRPESDRDGARLREALRGLMARWDAYGDGDGEELRRRAAVIVIGGATRLGEAELRALRRLALHGDLHVVSAHEALLALLAQALHVPVGVCFHPCASDALEATVRRATRLASGGQQLIASVEESGDGRIVRLALTELDRRVLVELPGVLHDGLTVTDAHGERVTLDGEGAHDRVRLFDEDGRTKLELRLTDGDAGAWQLAVPASLAGEVEVWAWGELALTVARPELLTVEGAIVAPRGGETIAIRGGAGSALSSARVAELGVSTVSDEATREVHAVRRRLDGVSEESARAATAPSLGIRLAGEESAREDTPRLRALRIEVRGTSPAGHPFARVLITTIVSLVPRRAFRAQRKRARAAKLLFVEGRVSAARADGAQPGALLLEGEGGRTRAVRVRDARLAALLGKLPLIGRRFHFGVAGEELTRVLHVLSDAAPAVQARVP